MADQAQAMVDAMLGRSRARLALAEAGRGSEGRSVFDEGGGVFSKKGGTSASSDFTGKLYGQDVTLPGVKTEPLTYTKRTDAAREALRRQFKTTSRFSGTRNNPGPVVENRANFLKDLANDPTKEASLRAAGIDDNGLALMKQGKIPDTDVWEVHHKLSLDEGGTNAQDNLVLTRIDPYHKVITNEQITLTKSLKAGETVQIPNWPVPDGFVYPPIDPMPPPANPVVP